MCSVVCVSCSGSHHCHTSLRRAFLQLNTKPQHHIHRGSRNLLQGWRREEPSAAFTGQCITLNPLFAGRTQDLGIWGSVRTLSFFCVFSLESYISKSPCGSCGSATRREIFFFWCLFKIAVCMIPKIYLLPTGFLNCSFCWHFEKSKINYFKINLLVSASKLRNGQVFLMVF